MIRLAAPATDRYSLLGVGQAWRNLPGLRTLVVTFVALAVLLSLAGAIRVPVISALINVIGIMLLLMGGTAAGMQFMEQASGRTVRGTAEALLGSPLVLLRSLGLALAIALLAGAFAAVSLVLLALCRIPGLGEALYIVVLPAVTFLAAAGSLVTLVALMLAAPSLWEGHSLRMSLLQLWAVVTQRPVEASLQLAALALVGLLVAGLAAAFVAIGFAVAVALSALVLSEGLIRPRGGGFDGLTWFGYLHSADMLGPGAVGAGIVVGVVLALVMAVMYLGLSLVHLRLAAGLDLARARLAMPAVFRMQDEPQAPPGPAGQEAPDSVPFLVDGSTILPLAIGCPRCLANVSPGDVYCGTCGNRLPQARPGDRLSTG